MPKEYECPACKNQVDRAATVCSNPVCRAELAFCSHCRDVTTFTLVEKATGRFGRDKYKCARCERVGVKCLTWLAGGYCNGLARAGEGRGKPLCATCTDRLGEVGRTVIGWSIIGAVGGFLRPKR
jgi:hypothetical protein